MIHLRKQQATSLVAVLSLATALIGTSKVVANDNIECEGTIGAVDTASVIVPDGETCTLEGTDVQGDVTVDSGATLISDGASIENNIQGESAYKVILKPGTVVQGNVQLQKGLDGGEIIIDQANIGGGLQLQDNLSSIRVSDSDIGSDMQVKNNDGGTEIVSNTIVNNLQCQDNDPAPTGGGNTAAQKQGQCENL